MSLREISHPRAFLQGLRQVVAKIADYPEACRLILPGGTISRQRRRIERFARQQGVHLPPIVSLASRMHPENYVQGVDKTGRTQVPSGVSIIIDDVASSGQKAWRMRMVHPASRILLVASKTPVPEADYIARRGDTGLVAWVLNGKTGKGERLPDPPAIEVFASKKRRS